MTKSNLTFIVTNKYKLNQITNTYKKTVAFWSGQNQSVLAFRTRGNYIVTSVKQKHQMTIKADPLI